MKILELPKQVQESIQEYSELELGGKKVVCPYYINLSRSKDLRAMVGKGSPKEIIMEAKIWEKLKGVDFDNMSDKDIKEFLKNRGIGIDCSGFVLHVLTTWFKSKKGKPIWRALKYPARNILKKISFLLKPVEKLGAEIITNQDNAYPITISEVLPGDVVRTKWKRQNSHHILLVSKVEKEQGKVKKIEYTHSIPQYGNDSGVKTGEIIITDAKKPLKDQKWTEVDSKGVNHVYEGFLINNEDNGLRRLKCLDDILK